VNANTEAFADTHPRVREAGKQALEDIGSVIRNPEVASLSSTLMAALSDARYYYNVYSILYTFPHVAKFS
jgi:hypothetical protein